LQLATAASPLYNTTKNYFEEQTVSCCAFSGNRMEFCKVACHPPFFKIQAQQAISNKSTITI
jgi:hypothetical protein